MANQGQAPNSQSYGQANDFFNQQSQMNQSSNPQSYGQGQDTNFLNQTGGQVKTMAHGAADIASGAAQGAMNLAQGAATGAANVAQGAADAIKNTFGNNPTANPADNRNTTTSSNLPTTNNPNTRI